MCLVLFSRARSASLDLSAYEIIFSGGRLLTDRTNTLKDGLTATVFVRVYVCVCVCVCMCVCVCVEL